MIRQWGDQHELDVPDQGSSKPIHAERVFEAGMRLKRTECLLWAKSFACFGMTFSFLLKL